MNRIGHVLAQERRNLVQVGNTRHHVETLAAAITFAQERLAQRYGIEGRDEGAHSQPVDGRRRDDGHFANAGQRELQCARNGRRGQRQHMHLFAQLLQAFFMAHAEMLLLIDDEKAEILERDRFRQQRMRADHNVDLSAFDAFAHLRQLLRRNETRSLRNLHRKTAEPLRKGLKCWRAAARRHQTATCLPSITARKAARSATSVLPKPTSPQMSRSISRPSRDPP